MSAADTVMKRFLETTKRQPSKIAVRFHQGKHWAELNWTDYRHIVESLAAGLQAAGVRKGDKVAILSNTRLEWAALDLAIMGLGALTVPIYPSSSADDVGFILTDSQAKVFFVENAGDLAKIGGAIPQEKPPKVVLIEKPVGADSSASKRSFTLLDEIQEQGEKALQTSPALYELAVEEMLTEDAATLIYTSGTTGRPRGVVHTHTQLLSEVSEAFPLLGVNTGDVSLAFLPFAHVLGRIEVWGHALIGYTMGFARSIDKIKDDLMTIEPTIIVAVPRIFEKIHAGILAQADISPLRRKAFDWALEVGRQVSICKQNKKAIPIEIALQYAAARRLVFDKIQARLGGRLRFAVCGGAPLNRQVAEFFHAAGLLILEGYGLTETTAAVCVNTPFDYRFGTVGKPIGDVKIKIAEDGEVLVKSRKVMREYYGDPASTVAAIQDGWFHTGDIGELDETGHLKITDRKKDLIKTAGGKYVAPQLLEGLVKLSPFVSNVHIHGDQKKYCVALITLAYDQVEPWAKENSVHYRTREELVRAPKIRELIRRAVADANANLAPFESIKNFAILPGDFTVESGELTPSLKVKRKAVDANHKAIIDSLY